MRVTRLLLGVIILLAMAASGCNKAGQSGGASLLDPSPEPVRDDPGTPAAAQNFKGPKRTIAVGVFNSTGAFSSKYGDWDVGGGLAAQLSTALDRSGRFIVLERANLDQILQEQRLKASGVSNPSTGPQLGNLTGVQFLIYGAVTEFGAEDKGGGMSLGVSGMGGIGGGLPNPLSGAISHERASGSVALDIRVVDTSTGQVIETHTVREAIESRGLSMSVNYANVSLGSDEFYKTPIGQATRRAIQRAVGYITLDAMKTPWTGQVVAVEGGNVVINVGSKAGAKPGDVFAVERVMQQYTDPGTGEVLGGRRERLGTVSLSDVQEKLSVGAFQALSKVLPQRGDIVVEQR